MKFNGKKAAALLLAILIMTSLTGCDALLDMLNSSTAMTITERIASFSTAINADERSASTILANFGPASDMTEYQKAEALTYWDIFPAEDSFTFTVTDSSTPSAVVVPSTRTDSSGNNLGDTTYKFVMYQETSGNYLIKEIWEDTTYLIKKVKF